MLTFSLRTRLRHRVARLRSDPIPGSACPLESLPPFLRLPPISYRRSFVRPLLQPDLLGDCATNQPSGHLWKEGIKRLRIYTHTPILPLSFTLRTRTSKHYFLIFAGRGGACSQNRIPGVNRLPACLEQGGQFCWPFPLGFWTGITGDLYKLAGPLPI